MGRSDDVARCHRYAERVAAGKVTACSLAGGACELHLRDLAAQPARGLYFDDVAARHALDFFAYLKHSKGEWAGSTFRLADWQCFIVGSIFGWMREDGTRRFRDAYIEVPRKNGKSTLAAGIGLYLFAADNEPGAEVYTAATKRDQARIVHAEAIRMVRKSPPLRSVIRIRRDNLSLEGTASKYEPLGADQGTDEGLNPHGAIIDELQAHKTSDLVDVLKTALGARRQPLIFRITTAGHNQQSVGREEHDHSEAVLKGTIEDDTWFAFIATIDEGDDWRTVKAARKANPNYGVSVKPAYLKDQVAWAANLPSRQSEVECKHFDIWTAGETPWIPVEVWDASAGTVDPEKLRGRECYGGLDLSSTKDLTAFVLDFPPEQEGGVHYALAFFWLPADDIKERSRRDRVPYDLWARKGFIELTEGTVIDYGFVRKKINELGDVYDIREIAYDPHGAGAISQDLTGDGFTIVPFRQGFLSMSAPMKELERLILAARAWHGGNVILRWMSECVTVKQDAADNIKPEKPVRQMTPKRIDGIVAWIMANGRSTLRRAQPEWRSA